MSIFAQGTCWLYLKRLSNFHSGLFRQLVVYIWYSVTIDMCIVHTHPHSLPYFDIDKLPWLALFKHRHLILTMLSGSTTTASVLTRFSWINVQKQVGYSLYCTYSMIYYIDHTRLTEIYIIRVFFFHVCLIVCDRDNTNNRHQNITSSICSIAQLGCYIIRLPIIHNNELQRSTST